jgi:uncharacterized protein
VTAGAAGAAGNAAQAGLIFPAAALLAEPPGSRRDYAFAVAGLDLGPDLVLVGPVSGRIRFSRTNRGLLVDGRVEAVLDEACSRCLRPIELPLDLRLDEEVLPSIDLASGRPVDPSLEPEIARLTDHHEVDLEPLVREAIQLAEPIAPVCRPDCPGLCPTCGEPLEEGSHDHDETILDPRLEALRSFRVDGGPETG